MARYELEYKDAVWWYEDELEEMDKIAKLSPYELVQFLKKEKEEEKRRHEEYEKEMEERKMEQMYGENWRDVVPVKERNYWVLDHKIMKAKGEHHGQFLIITNINLQTVKQNYKKDMESNNDT